MTMTSRRPKEEMTEFGKTLNRMMVLHDVYEWKDLLVRLEGIGFHLSQSGLSQYLYGIRRPRDLHGFLDAVAEALDLSQEEKMELTMSYVYGNRPVNGGISDTNGDAGENNRN